MIKKTLLLIFIPLSLIIIVLGIFLLIYKKPQAEKFTKLSDFADMLGKRVAFEGIVNQGLGNFEPAHVLVFGDSKLRMTLCFKEANPSAQLHEDSRFYEKLGFPDMKRGKTQWAYMSGIVTYVYRDFERDPVLKDEPGMSSIPEFRYGIFGLYDPQVIKVLPIKNPNIDTISHKIKVYHILEEDKSLQSPFLINGNQESFNNYIEYLRARGN